MSRANERSALEQDMRIVLLEQDADAFDKAFMGVREELKLLGDKLSGLSKILVGMLISITTTSILLAINLIVSNN